MAKFAEQQILDDLCKLKRHAMKLIVDNDSIKTDIRHLGPGEAEEAVMMDSDSERFILTVYNCIANIEKALKEYEDII